MQFSGLIEPRDVAAIDAACLRSHIPGYRLMQSAGRAVAAVALRDYPDAHRFLVLAGPGNNGGDAYVAAEALAEAGACVCLYQLIAGRPTTADAARALDECRLAPQGMGAFDPQPDDVVIDGLFGAGLARDLSGDAADAIGKTAQSGATVIAIDLPSGIDGLTGAIRGAAFQASITVTFMGLKPGMLLMPGRAHCGTVEVADIGVPGRLIKQHASSIVINGPAIWAKHGSDLPASSHKYTRGALVVFSGGAAHTGAARLSAEAGLRAGAGLVTIASPSDAMAVNAGATTAVMVREIEDAAALSDWLASDSRIRNFVLGPGFGTGDKARQFVSLLASRQLVLDADGISSFRDDPEALFSLFARGETRLVLTPHEGEFARLFPDLDEAAMPSKVDRARAAARRANSVVIYKGADTVIAAPDGRAAINTNAPPWLATAGSGDVLAGICGALMAQGFPAYEAACAAVWHHGEAGNRAGRGLTAETLIKHIEV